MLQKFKDFLLKLLSSDESANQKNTDISGQSEKIKELEQINRSLQRDKQDLINKSKEKKNKEEQKRKVEIDFRQDSDKQESVIKAKEKAKKIILDAKEEALKIKERADEYQNKIIAKQDEIDNSFRKINTQKEKIEKIKEETEAKKARVTKLEEEREKKILELSSLTKQEATNLLLNDLDKKLTTKYAQKIKLYEEKLLAESEQKGREMLLDVMHHGSTDYVAEFSVSTVKFDDSQIKGKIIGKEGRNIKTFEELTGVDLDLESDENEARLSSFDPIRREIAKLSLEKLIKDGRVHPARIEEVVNKTTKEMEKIIYSAGEDLCNRLKVYNLPRDLLMKLGQFKFRTSYGQNMIKHTLEETQMGVKLAKELGADVAATKLACLLHDIGKVIIDKEGNHMDLGADYIKKLGMPDVVVDAVRESHDDKPSNIIGVIVQIVDSISGARPGARYEDYENYVERMQKLEDLAMNFEGVNKAYAISAGREVRVIVEPDKINDAQIDKLSFDIAQKIAKIQDFPGIVKVTVIREKRSFAYTTG